MSLTSTLAYLEGIWTQAGGAPQAAPQAAAIAYAESTGNANSLCYDYVGADNQTHCSPTANPPGGTGQVDVGLWQIGTGGPAGNRGTINQLLDPITNALQAISISGNGKNFSDWTTLNSPTYQQALANAPAVGVSPSQQQIPMNPVCASCKPGDAVCWFLNECWNTAPANSPMAAPNPQNQASTGLSKSLTQYWWVAVLAVLLFVVGLTFIGSNDNDSDQNVKVVPVPV